MAILKQGHMKEDRTSSNPSRHLKVAIAYILSPQKCENGRLAGAVHCVADKDLAYEQMMRTKRIFRKLHGRQGYHYILSFTEGEITPETACEITEKFIQGYLEERYEVVYAVHTDTEHMHAHIIFNSVGLDGYKYHAPRGEWRQNIMPVVNQLCAEYGLSEIRLDQEEAEEKEPEKDIFEGKIPFEMEDSLKKAVYAAETDVVPETDSIEETVAGTPAHSPKTGEKVSNGKRREKVKSPLYGRKGSGYGSSAACLSAMLRRDIDECIGGSGSLDEFYQKLRNRGYSLRISENRVPALKHEGMERVRRFSSLGEGYSIEEIEERILSGEKPEPEPGISEEELPKEVRAIAEERGLEEFIPEQESIGKKISREISVCLLVSGEAYSRACISSRATLAYNDFYNLRDAYEFIRKYNIQSAADLDILATEYGRKLTEARTALRKTHRSLGKDEEQAEQFTLVQQYRELIDAVLLYENGDESFYKDYLRAQRILDRIAGTGTTLEEAEKELDFLTSEIETQKRKMINAQEMLRRISNVRSAVKRETPEEQMEQLMKMAKSRNREKRISEGTENRTDRERKRSIEKGRRI